MSTSDPMTVNPTTSRATRHLCAGMYLSRSFCMTTMELIYHRRAQAFIPNPGIDSAKVMSHALHAHRSHLGRAWLMVGLSATLFVCLGSSITATTDGDAEVATLIAAIAGIGILGLVITSQVFDRWWLKRLRDDQPFPETPQSNEYVNWLPLAESSEVITYFGSNPFRYSGVSKRDWDFALPLKPAHGSAGEQCLSTTSLMAHIHTELSGLATDSRLSVRLPELQIVDRFFVSGSEISSPAHNMADLTQLATKPSGTGFLHYPIGPVRHFLQCEIASWDGELITTVYVHAALQGETLYMAFHSYLIPPTQTRFHVLTDELDDKWDGVKAYLRAVLMTPVRPITDAVYVLQRCAHIIIRALRSNRPLLDIQTGLNDCGGLTNLRTLGAASQPHTYFQSQDAAKYIAILEAQLLETTIDFLEDKVDTSQLRGQRQTIVNNNIVNEGPVYTASQTGTGVIHKLVTRLVPGKAAIVKAGQAFDAKN